MACGITVAGLRGLWPVGVKDDRQWRVRLWIQRFFHVNTQSLLLEKRQPVRQGAEIPGWGVMEGVTTAGPATGAPA